MLQHLPISKTYETENGGPGSENRIYKFCFIFKPFPPTKCLKMEKLQQYDNSETKRTPTERAYYHREQSENIAEILETAASEASDDIAFALSQRLKACSSRYNYYLADDLNNSEGECFDGFGNLYGCGSKLCHGCVSKAAKRNRKLASEAIQQTKLKRREHKCLVKNKYVVENEKYRFITLTMPKVPLSCKETLSLLSRAWQLFRKLEFTKIYLPGYVKSVEFTVRSDNSYHAHIHLLAISFYIPEQMIKRLWRRCLQAAFSEFGLDWRCETKNNKPVVNLKLADNTEKALLEVCKYVTKSESWGKVPAEHLLEVANIKRWGRMFELAGSLKKTAQRIKLKKEIDKEIQVELEQNNVDQDYLDTKEITDGGSVVENNDNIHESLCEIEKIPRKQKNWRSLVVEKGLKAYLKILERQVEVTQRVRKELLIEKYPLAKFTDLAGFCWYQPQLAFMEEVLIEKAV
jgi:hypothetical protein